MQLQNLKESLLHSWLGHALYVSALAAWAVSIPAALFDPTSHRFILILGVLAAWRYGWAMVNWARFLVHQHIQFPKWRAEANLVTEEELPSHVYLLVTSFRIGTETTRRVYDSVIREAMHYGRPVTIVASIVERCDEMLIKQLFAHHAPPSHVTLSFVRIAGTGKRDALAFGFRAISKMMPQPDDVVAVVDGDSLLSENLIQRTACFFVSQPDLGALTTDETCEVEGAWSFREWYNLRFAQRNVFMSSASLSRRVLTLTGRMSMFRASIATDPKFIKRVELDWIDHWRLGRFKFLTGDDKSTWYHLISQGIPMLYVPDVTVLTIETPPHPNFFVSAHMLMKRWSGNMLRNNTRALALGWKKVSFFPWMMILDQRISIWTSLTSPTFALLGGLIVSPVIISYYFFWIFLSRYLITLTLLASRPKISITHPFFLYFNQIFGSFIKSVVFFQLDKQKWTRQNTTLINKSDSWQETLSTYGSRYMQYFSLTALVTFLATVADFIHPPSLSMWLGMVGI